MQLRLLAAIGLFGMLAFSQNSKAQSIAVGAPSLEDYLRRLQLTGKVDSAASFMIRPLIPTAAFGLAHGFDLDGGCSACVIEFCLSYNNSGPGFLVCSFGGPDATVYNTVRYSVSYNDGRE